MESFKKRIKQMTDQQLEDEYEKRRVKWYEEGLGDITKEMEMLNDEMNNRISKKVDEDLKKNNKKPIYWSDKNRWEKD